MKFTNLIAYCKGFYKRNAGSEGLQMILCVHADGETNCSSKETLIKSCLSKLDWFALYKPTLKDRITYYSIYCRIKQAKEDFEREHPDIPVSDEDAILLGFIDFVRYELDYDDFDEGVIPSDKVLPVNDNVEADWYLRDVKKFKPQFEEKSK